MGATVSGVKDTRFVGLEDRLVSLNKDCKWLLGKGSLHLVLVVLAYLRGSRNLNGGSGRFIVGAGTSLLGSARNVRVDGLKFSSMLLQVSVSPERVSTIAAHVGEAGAVNELLLREAEEFSGGNKVCTLKSAGSGERPAGTALALILNIGDGSGSNPVDFAWEILGIELINFDHLWLLLSREHTACILSLKR